MKNKKFIRDYDKVQPINYLTMTKPEVNTGSGFNADYIVGDSNSPINQPMMSTQSVLDNRMLESMNFLGYPLLSFLMQHPILAKYCKVFSEDATREFIKFTSQAEEDKTDKIADLNKYIKKYKVREIIRKMLRLSLGFGGCTLYVKMKNDADIDEYGTVERDTPLILTREKITIGSVENFLIVEPYWIAPTQYNASNPLDNDFYEPKIYTVMGNSVHQSRLIKMIPFEVPVTMKPFYNFFGYPAIQWLMPYVEDFDKLRDEVTKLVNRMNTNVIKTSMDEVFNDEFGGGLNTLHTRIKNMNKEANNFGAIVLDKDMEDFTQISMPLQNVDAILNQYAELICIPAGMPATKLMGTSPKGFNATGSHDMKNYYDTITSINESCVRSTLEQMLKVIMLNEWGYIDEDIEFEFNALEQMNDLEKADLQLKNAQRDSTYVQAGILSTNEVVKQLATSPDSPYTSLDAEALELQSQEDLSVNDNFLIDPNEQEDNQTSND